MTRPMLVGVSRSEASDRAVDWAADRAARTGSPIVLVHMLDSFLATLDNSAHHEAAVDAGRELLAEAALRVRAIAPDAAVEEVLHTGSSVPSLFGELAHEREAELIVVGSDTTGRPASTPRGVGSLRVAAAAEAPVAIVPVVDVSDRRGVVVGVDGSDIAARAFDFAVAEAANRGEPLIAVHGWFDPSMHFSGEFMLAETETQVRERVTEFVEGLFAPHRAAHPDLELEVRTLGQRPVDAIRSAAEEGSLLVVGSHGRGAFRRLLLGSVSHEVLMDVTGPTIVVR